MSKVFMAKYVESLKGKIPDLEKNQVNKLFKKKWVVYAKCPFGHPASVIEYLGRYTHKVAISNHRLLSIENRKVTLSKKIAIQAGKTMQKQQTATIFISGNGKIVKAYPLFILLHYRNKGKVS